MKCCNTTCKHLHDEYYRANITLYGYFTEMSMFLSLKAALTEPSTLSLAFQFHVATATWLVHMTTAGEQQTTFGDVTFPLADTVPTCMSCIPELVAENLMDFLLFLRRYKDAVYEVCF